MAVRGQSFGKISNFGAGDLVSWTRLDSKHTGIVSDLYFSTAGTRKVAFAKIFCFEDEENHDILCINLKIVSENDETSIKN
tara:strand:- start:828 stop:1070 length:243 start_codon:yes stop_codon:yes gene_type:complete